MSIFDESGLQRLVASLWVLVMTARSGPSSKKLEGVARASAEALSEPLRQHSHLVLQERDGGLYVNGHRVRPDVQGFAATAGIAQTMQQWGVGELFFGGEATVDELLQFARTVAQQAAGRDLSTLLRDQGCESINASQAALAPLASARAESARLTPRPPSQLGAMFTMQQLSTAMDRDGPLSGSAAFTVLQAVVGRLLADRSCLASLQRVERHPLAHREALRACVLAVRAADAMGWDEERSLSAGAAALLGVVDTACRDVDAANLARAARAVATLLDTSRSPEDVLSDMLMHGQLDGLFADALLHGLGG
jgi:hypothetical protein